MRSLFIPWLFGVFTGWTCGALYVAFHDDDHLTQLQDERALRIQGEREIRAAQSAELAARRELDTIRRDLIRGVATEDRVERIPKQNVPTR